MEVPSANSNDSNSGESNNERSTEEANRTEDKDIGTQHANPITDNTESMLSVANPNQDQDDSQDIIDCGQYLCILLQLLKHNLHKYCLIILLLRSLERRGRAIQCYPY